MSDRFNNASTISRWPLLAAQVKAVLPLLDFLFTSESDLKKRMFFQLVRTKSQIDKYWVQFNSTFLPNDFHILLL